MKNLLLRAMKALREAVPNTESLTLPKDRWLEDDREGDPNKSQDNGP